MNIKEKNCKPCEESTPVLTFEQEERFRKETPLWEVDRSDIHKLRRTFALKDFLQAITFVGLIAPIAEAQGHHPDIHISYRNVTIELWTHKIKGLSENDFILASKIDDITLK
jgi:4a-hydroxytetrahydrobiopterin dehydratase